jgi:peptide/nickel transport system ATP-binding protein
MSALLQVEELVRDYRRPGAGMFGRAPRLRVLHGVSLTVAAGEALGIVGESGCGKSTLARAVMALERPQAGRVVFAGADLFALDRRALRAARRGFQAIFQDPYGSLDPRQTVARIIAEPVAALERGTSAVQRRARVLAALDEVGLPASAAGKYPHEFSGGQRQRIAIARALVTRPALIVADEPVAALDVSGQAQVLNLMLDLRERLGVAMLFISHDLGVVRWVTERVAVMFAGRIIEEGPTQRVFDAPLHPYTKALADAVPRPDAPASRVAEPGEAAAQGCPYAPRCPLVQPRCRVVVPELRTVGMQRVACHEV